MAYSEDLRIRLVRKVASGMSRRQAAARFARRYEDEGTVAVKPRSPQKRRLDPYGEDFFSWIEAIPDMTQQELPVRLHEVHQVRAPISAIDDWLWWRKISFKKYRPRQRTGTR